MRFSRTISSGIRLLPGFERVQSECILYLKGAKVKTTVCLPKPLC